MFSFFLPKEIDANKVSGRRDVREALILAARNNITIINIDYFMNHDNYRRFQSAIMDLCFDYKDGKIPRLVGAKLAMLGDKYGLNKLFDAERNEKYFSQLEEAKRRSIN